MVLCKNPSKVRSISGKTEIQFDTNIARYKIKVFLSLRYKYNKSYLFLYRKGSNKSTYQLMCQPIEIEKSILTK